MNSFLKTPCFSRCLLVLIFVSSTLTFSSHSALPSKKIDTPGPVNNVVVKSTPKIIGGGATAKNLYPFMTAIVSANSNSIDGLINSRCGASFIGGRYVLSAAHCFANVRAQDIDVWIGGHDLSNASEGRRVSVQQIYLHEQYDAASYDKDIAVLELSEVITDIEPIKLITPAIEATLNEGDLLTIMGWGNTSANTQIDDYPLILQSTDVPLYNRAACLAAYGTGEITNDMMCAGYIAGGQDTCQGDSGGPLVYQYQGQNYQAGVVSFGNGCALANSPGIYSRVASLLTWIQSKQQGVSYVQLTNIGFVESEYRNDEVVTITNIGNQEVVLTNVQLHDEVNLVSLNLVENRCSSASLLSNQSCDIVIDTAVGAAGPSSFILTANASTTPATEIRIQVSLTALPSTSIDVASAAGGSDSVVTWYSGGDSPWELRTNRASNGTSSVASGDIDDFETSVLLAKVQSPLVQAITYDYFVSSELNYDFLDVAVNGNLVDSFSGVSESDFNTKTIELSPGTNRISFSYTKDESQSFGEDRAYIDGISFDFGAQNPIIMVNQSTVTVEEGATFTLDASGSRDPENQTLSFSWTVVGNASALVSTPNAISTSITAPNFADTPNMLIRLTVTNSLGAQAQTDIEVTITQTPVVSIPTPVVTPQKQSSGGGVWGLSLLFLYVIARHRKRDLV